MKLFSTALVRKISLITLILFVFSTFAVEAQTEVTIPVNTTQPVDISLINAVLPELNSLQANLRTTQNTLSTLESLSTPLYNQVVPTGMQAMSISERIKAILLNAKSLLGNTIKNTSATAQFNMNSGVSPVNLPLDQQLAYSVEQLGASANEIQFSLQKNSDLSGLKAIIASIKDKLQSIINIIRAKIFAVGQKVGLISKDKRFEDGKVVENKGTINAAADVQYADTFSGKLSKGVNEGVANAKASLKNSFSFSNLALTTTVAVGTNLAIDMIHGEKPSLKKAVKAVASMEFAGSVVGSALGAAGGQFTATLVKSFIPGPVGAMVGAVIPVMFASATGQMGAGLVSGLKNGEFSIAKAWKQVDKADLVGSSIGSTIGMALGAPIPVVGPIIGGIVGGLLGSKVSQWITGFAKGRKVSFFGRGSGVDTSTTPTRTGGFSVGIGSIAGPNNNSGPVVFGSQDKAVFSTSTVSASPETLKAAEKKYYDAYLQYNRLVESGDTAGAKKVFEQLKVYSDEYNSLKKQVNGK